MPIVPDPAPSGDPILPRPAPPRTVRERIEQVADATGTTPARILLGGAAAIVAVLVALWLTKPPAPPPEVSLPFASTTASLAPASADTLTDEVLVVHVAGAVTAPGVYELPSGSRVVDAIESAGGLASDADGTRINLASPVTDGERIYVPRVGETEPPVAVGAGGAAGDASPGAPLDLNEADEAALDALPGIGPTTASAIVEHRARIGRFTSVEQLLDVRGIGEAKLEQLRPLVTV